MRKNSTKRENALLKKQFISDFASGKVTLEYLAQKYGIGRRKLLIWKKEVFGTGSLKQKRMYQMNKAGIPPKVIAEFYEVHIFQVQKAIRDITKRVESGTTFF